jgi:tetratricopeptide (TPR) repeat protein
MTDTNRVLQPLKDAENAIAKLGEYETATELGSAVQDTWIAVERSLRLLLRTDAAAPDDLRLNALSPSDLPFDRLVPALRQRDLISLQLAGRVHELQQAAERARAGGVRAGDADQARAVVEQLRTEVQGGSAGPVREVAHHAVEAGRVEEPAQMVPLPRRHSFKRVIVLPIILLLLVVMFIWGVTRDTPMEDAVTAFRSNRLAQAEQQFRQIAEEDEENVDARLYLARIYRRSNQPDDAARMLREAAQLAPNDDDVERELGWFFLDRNQPQSAAAHFRKAQELNPDENANLIGLITSLRRLGDPEAERLLAQAPPDVRAAFTTSR